MKAVRTIQVLPPPMKMTFPPLLSKVLHIIIQLHVFTSFLSDRVSSNVASEESLEEDALMEANLGLIFNMDLPSDRVTMQHGN